MRDRYPWQAQVTVGSSKGVRRTARNVRCTYERILKAIPAEHREFAQTTLSILVAQSELGSKEAQMSPRALLRMILQTLKLDLSTDHFYNIFDIRETCGCLVIFTLYLPLIGSCAEGRERKVVLLAHYTVKEFLYAERTARSLDAVILKFALEEDATVTHWAKTVLDVALAAPPTDNPMSSDSLDDYCQGVAPLIVKTWDKVLPTLGLRGECLQLLNPAGAHHSRRANKRTLFLE